MERLQQKTPRGSVGTSGFVKWSRKNFRQQFRKRYRDTLCIIIGPLQQFLGSKLFIIDSRNLLFHHHNTSYHCFAVEVTRLMGPGLYLIQLLPFSRNFVVPKNYYYLFPKREKLVLKKCFFFQTGMYSRRWMPILQDQTNSIIWKDQSYTALVGTDLRSHSHATALFIDFMTCHWCIQNVWLVVNS